MFWTESSCPTPAAGVPTTLQSSCSSSSAPGSPGLKTHRFTQRDGSAPTNLCQCRPAVVCAWTAGQTWSMRSICDPLRRHRMSKVSATALHLSSRLSLHHLCLRSFGAVAKLDPFSGRWFSAASYPSLPLVAL